jgi:hypothetical protein
MERYVYIQKDTREIDVELDEKIDENTSPVGTTWEDYVDGAWLLLSAEQVAFRDAHPDASVQEVFNMRLNPVPQPPPPPQRTLTDAIREKIVAIDAYDANTVNQFYIHTGEVEIPWWFDAQQRATYQTSINSRRKLIEKGVVNDTTIRMPFAGQLFTLLLDDADVMLAMLQNYADETYNVTYLHKAAVEASTQIDEVDAYDFTTGYPEKLTFNL